MQATAAGARRPKVVENRAYCVRPHVSSAVTPAPGANTRKKHRIVATGHAAGGGGAAAAGGGAGGGSGGAVGDEVGVGLGVGPVVLVARWRGNWVLQFFRVPFIREEQRSTFLRVPQLCKIPENPPTLLWDQVHILAAEALLSS